MAETSLETSVETSGTESVNLLPLTFVKVACFSCPPTVTVAPSGITSPTVKSKRISALYARYIYASVGCTFAVFCVAVALKGTAKLSVKANAE